MVLGQVAQRSLQERGIEGLAHLQQHGLVEVVRPRNVLSEEEVLDGREGHRALYRALSLAHLVRRSKHGAKRMLKMILDLLDVEGLEEGRLAPTIDCVDIPELVRVAVEDSEVSAQQKEVRLDLVTTERIVAEADPVLMRRVIDNLIANALTQMTAS